MNPSCSFLLRFYLHYCLLAIGFHHGEDRQRRERDQICHYAYFTIRTRTGFGILDLDSGSVALCKTSLAAVLERSTASAAAPIAL